MPAPLVSVILPTYDRASMLTEAVGSVVAQTFTDWECIVADDGSTDGTSEALARIPDPRVRAVTMAHSGNPAMPRNAALAVARGKLVAFLDDDDLWMPDKLAVQIPLCAEGKARWSYTGYVKRDADGRETWRSTPDRLPSGHILGALLALRAAIALPTVMAERAFLEEVGGFDPAFRTREDYALWLTLAARAPAAVTTEHLTVVRDHPGRVFRPEANRMSVVLYQQWLDRLPRGALRRICRRRLAETHLTEAARARAAGRTRAAWPPVLRAARQAPVFTVGRLLRAVTRRIVASRPAYPHGTVASRPRP